MAISYPIDVENTRWAVYNTDTSTILRRSMKWPRADGQEIVGAPANIVPLLEVTAPKPAPSDPATLKVIADDPVVDVPGNTLTQAWQEVAMSQEEQDIYAEAQANAAELELVKSVYQALKNGTGTDAQRLTRVERVLAFLIKRDYSPS